MSEDQVIFKKKECTFADPEQEAGIITRVQEYSPPFVVCGLKYVGKITVREVGGEVYQAFVIPESKVYGKNGEIVPHDKLVDRIAVGSKADYVFKERIYPNRTPERTKGLLIEMKVSAALKLMLHFHCENGKVIILPPIMTDLAVKHHREECGCTLEWVECRQCALTKEYFDSLYKQGK